MDAKLKQCMNTLPKTAGVYLFYEGSDLIYIGKAINIKDRAKNHFQQPSYRDNLFIEKVSRIDFINTNSEIEALVLEANLIKKHLPKFNVVWKDDKNYFYVCITKDERPVVFITHQKNDARAKYIGPFIEGTPLKKTLKYLRRVFPFYTAARHSARLCQWCHLDLCPGPNPNLLEYKKNLKKLTLILQGQRPRVLSDLKKEMESFSKAGKFEEAAKVRDKMLALERILEHTHVIEQNLEARSWNLVEKQLQEIIGVKTPISKIECYDISNIQGKNAVGSMVVFVDGVPDKSQYRKFKIRMKNEPNDIAMLSEIISRRLNNTQWPYPEVMLIDGGIAQLNIAIKAKSGENIKIISIAKGKQELLIEGKPKLPLKDLPQEIYNLVKHLDDEAHRFAITYHKKLRKRALLDPKA